MFKFKFVCFEDTTEIKIDETTVLVTELIEATTDSTELFIFPCPDCGATNEVDAVTIHQPPVESATQIDLESVIIDLGVDRLTTKDAEIGLKIAQSVVADEKTLLTTETAQAVQSSTEVLLEPVENAPRDTPVSPSIEEKVEIVGDVVSNEETTSSAVTSQEEILSTEESVTMRPEADSVIHIGLKVDLKNQTKEGVEAALFLSDPADISQDSTPSFQQKVEITADSETTRAATASLEEALSTEIILLSETLRPETDSEIHIVLKADFKTPSEERNEGTEAIVSDTTIQPEFVNDAEATELTKIMPGDVPIETTSVPLSDENEEFRTVVTDVVEEATHSTVDFTDSGTDATDTLNGLDQDEIVLMEPQLVKIFDPSIDVEATTFLAEANMQTEWDVTATTESLYQADGVERIEEEETLTTTTDELVMLTIGTESGTESVTESMELMGETTTALPVSVKLSPPSSNNANVLTTTKKRSYKGYKGT